MPETTETTPIPKGFGRRNVHCNNCGDERGGPFGHEASECRYRSGMAAYEAVEIQPEHRRAEFWDVLIDRYLAMELGEFTVTLNRANPATTAEPACGDSGLHPGWLCDLPAGHPERQHRQRVSGGVNTWEHEDATAEPADEQDDESLFESHRQRDGAMPATIPVSDPEHDAPDGATIDGYTRQRNTWVKNAEPAAG